MRQLFTKHFFLFILATAAFHLLRAQTIQSAGIGIINNLPTRSTLFNPGGSGLKKSSNCGTDTVNYTYNKTTLLNTITLNSATSGNSFAQWYPCPQAITIHGFEFYAWQTAMNSTVVPITCRLYNAGIDSMPVGTPLASTTINVDSTFGGGMLTALRKKAIFSTPVTTASSNGYVIVIETSSSTSVAVVSNSWTAAVPNGRSEWLSSVKINTTFIRSYNINVGGIPFNADFIMQPFVSYTLNANFSPSTSCISPGNPITFTNTSSPVLFSRFYSVRAFMNIPQFSCLWDYGDSTGSYYALHGNKTYIHNTTYRVRLLDTLYGWMNGCGDTYMRDISQSPDPTSATNNGPICSGGTLRLFADSVAGVNNYYWTGPNGFSSNQRNPEIPSAGIAASGLYSVNTVIGQCSSSVVTTYASVINTYSSGSNGPLCVGQNLSLSTTEVNGAVYAWTGPNGFTSNIRNPIRTNLAKADSGNYLVSITLAGCGTIGPLSTLVVVNDNPATPVASNNGPVCVGQNLSLTATGGTGGLYVWNGPNNFTSTQQNPVRPSASNTFAGTYSVSFTKNGCTSQVGTTNVVVNNNPPPPIAGNNGPVCTSQILSLTASLIPNASYTWSGPNNFISSIQNPTRDSLSLLDGGTYSVIATVNGCASPVATTVASITSSTPAPTAGSNGPLCPGQNLQLTASAISGATYSWTGPKSFVSALQNPIISNINDSNAGIYSVTASTTACGISSAATVLLVVNALPPSPNVGNNGPMCVGQNLNLTASDITGASYFWSGPGGFSSGSKNPVINNVSKSNAGVYSVYVTVAGCGTSGIANTLVVVHSVPNIPSTSSNSPVCMGDTIVLNANSNGVGPNANYNWNGPNNFNSGNKQAIINSALISDAGVYSVSVNDSGCNSANGSVNVQVRNLPAAPVPSSNSPICSGANLNLQSTSISGATYLWQGPNNFSSGAQNPSISGADSKNEGTYSIRSFVNGCASIPATINIVINPLPAAPVATNTGPVCVGENVNLRASTITGATYNWSGPGFNSALQNPILVNATKAMSGTYSVSATLNACTSLEAKTDVVVNSIPDVPVLSSNPAVSACTGDSLRLYAGNVPDGIFEWTGPLGFGSSKQNPVLFVNNTAMGGAYNATVSRFGCVSPKATLNIQVHGSPATTSINGLSDVRSGETQSYSVNGTAGSTFNWTITGGTIQSGAGSPAISVLWGPKGSGNVSVLETSSVGCKGIQQNKVIAIGYPAGIAEQYFSDAIAVFPNPATNKMIVNIHSDRTENTRISLLDITGRTIREYSYEGTSNNLNQEYSVEGIKSGMYLLYFKQGNLISSKKLVIE